MGDFVWKIRGILEPWKLVSHFLLRRQKQGLRVLFVEWRCKGFLHGCENAVSWSLLDRFWSPVSSPFLSYWSWWSMAGFVSHPVSHWGPFLATTLIMLAAGAFIESAWGFLLRSTMPQWIPLVALGDPGTYVYSVFALFVINQYFESAGFILFLSS